MKFKHGRSLMPHKSKEQVVSATKKFIYLVQEIGPMHQLVPREIMLVTYSHTHLDHMLWKLLRYCRS